MSIHELEMSTTKKVKRHIIPYIILLYIIAFLDRVNIGYAALDMNKALALTSEQFGMIAGIFFIGYFFFEVPSNILLHKIGARIWIARILVSWGIVAVITGAANSAQHLYILRFLLGVAEAGFFPGMILYITYWFRGKDQARAYSLFLTSMALTNIIGAPISGVILDHAHWAGIENWRWLFVIEGIPAILCGAITLSVLKDRPNNATWLTDEEKAWLNNELEQERLAKEQKHAVSTKEVWLSGRVWTFALSAFCIVVGLYGIGFWMPQIIKTLSAQYSNTTVGLLTAIPYICAIISMVSNGLHSDKTMDRRWHSALPPLIGGLAMIALTFTASPILSIILLSVIAAGIFGFFPPFWSFLSECLTGSSAAIGIAIVSSVSNLGGFFGPYIIGYVKNATGSMDNGLYAVAAFLILGCLSLLLLGSAPKAAPLPATDSSRC